MLLLRYQNAGNIDPLELHEEARGGVSGLFGALRDGTVQVLNAPGAGYAEALGLASLLPVLCRRVAGPGFAQLRSVESRWLGDADSAAMVAANPAGVACRIGPGRVARSRRIPPPSTKNPGRLPPSAGFRPASCRVSARGEVLEPRGVSLRLFLLHDGAGWRPLPGGIARMSDDPALGKNPAAPRRMSKDVWVLEEEGADIMGPGNLAVPALPIRRMSGDMPSRVADNFYWFGRYLERAGKCRAP